MEGRQSIIDVEHLRLLSMFYYIMGGITCLYALLPVLHLIMGIVMLNLGSISPEVGAELSSQFAGWMMIAIASSIIFMGLTLGILQLLTATFIKKRSHRVFCFVISIISCLALPFGTILGICSIKVINKDTVKKIFAEK